MVSSKVCINFKTLAMALSGLVVTQNLPTCALLLVLLLLVGRVRRRPLPAFLTSRLTMPRICPFSLMFCAAGSLLLVGIGNAHFDHNEPFDENNDVPSCRSVANDPDGDGFGWQTHHGVGLTHLRYRSHSCVVDSNTLPKPDFVKYGEELRPLNMERTFWDPSVDFVNKEIACNRFSIEEPEPWQWPVGDRFTIKHFPLPDEYPWLSEYEITFPVRDEAFSGIHLWTAEHGRYSGARYFYNPEESIGLLAGLWGEPIDINGQLGMRFWDSTEFVDSDQPNIFSSTRYQECVYSSGEPFRPTGRWDKAPTSSNWAVPELPLLDSGPPESEKPIYTDPATGGLVDLKSFSWNIKDDLLYKRFSCDHYTWRGTVGDFGNGIWDNFEFPTDMIIMPPLSGELGKIYLWFNGREPGQARDWTVEDGKLTGAVDLPSNGWYDFTEWGGTRIWLGPVSVNMCSQYPVTSLTPTGAVAGDNDNLTDQTNVDDGTNSDDNNNTDNSSVSTGSTVPQPEIINNSVVDPTTPAPADENSNPPEASDSADNTQMQTQTSDQASNINTDPLANPVPEDTEPTSTGGGGGFPFLFLLLLAFARKYLPDT